MFDKVLHYFRMGKWAVRMTWSINRRLFSGVIVANVMQSIVPLGLALSLRGIVNSVIIKSNDGGETYHVLFFWLAVGLVLAICEECGKHALTYFTDRLRDELNIRISTDIMIHADSLDMTYFEDPRFQDIMMRANQRTAVNFLKFVSNVLQGLRHIVQSASLIGLLVYMDPLIVILLLPVAIPFLLFQWRLLKKTFEVEQSKTTKYRLVNYYTGLMTRYESIPEIKILKLGPWITEKFNAVMSEFRDKDRKLYLRDFLLNSGFVVISTIIAYAVFTRVAFKVLNGGLTVGDVAIFGGAALRLRLSIHYLVIAATRAMEQTLYISNLNTFFNIRPKTEKAEKMSLVDIKGGIGLADVSFTYPGSNAKVLEDVSLDIRPGETVALVGENGAGKTTLVKLIVGFYSPDKGTVLFDGRDVRTLSQAFLHSRISFMFQNFGRYEASIADNIAYGDYGRLKDNPDKIKEIARSTDIHNFIETMPEKYDTLLGREFGTYSLSGGQWQQVALARTFAKDAKVLILDEPTSNMDIRSEYELFSKFSKFAKGRTTILISHRFSTVSMAERIFVMDNRRIIERGSHRELMEQDGHYAEMYRLHFKKLQGI